MKAVEMFKYPSWRYPGQYTDATNWFDLKLLLLAIAVIGVTAATLIFVSRGVGLRGLRMYAGVGIKASGMVRRLDPASEGPQILLDYEWHDDRINRNADRKDRPLYLRNSSDSDAMNVKISPIEHRRVKANFDLIPHLNKENSPFAIKPTMEHNSYPYSQIRHKFTNSPQVFTNFPPRQ